MPWNLLVSLRDVFYFLNDGKASETALLDSGKMQGMPLILACAASNLDSGSDISIHV